MASLLGAPPPLPGGAPVDLAKRAPRRELDLDPSPEPAARTRPASLAVGGSRSTPSGTRSTSPPSEIGLGAGSGRNAPIVRTLARLVDFHVAEIVDGHLGMHTMLLPRTRRQAAHLPDHLADRHREETALVRPRCPTAAITRAVLPAEFGP